jgi:hypothetical protein
MMPSGAAKLDGLDRRPGIVTRSTSTKASQKAGDVLFRVDPLQFQIALDNAKANPRRPGLRWRR